MQALGGQVLCAIAPQMFKIGPDGPYAMPGVRELSRFYASRQGNPMLHVNVGISRKLTKDFNSTGFSVNLEGEISAPLDEPEMVIEKIREFYDLAEEALRDQIERYDGVSAIASRDQAIDCSTQPANGNGSPTKSHHCDATTTEPQLRTLPASGSSGRDAATSKPAEEKATNKQVQFLLNLAKRQGLTTQTLENRIAEAFGHRIGTYELTKRQAGQLIDSLNPILKSVVGSAQGS
jgi:hypothetical protein